MAAGAGLSEVNVIPEWLRNLRRGEPRKESAPRLKTYTAESGYVYHYFHEARRERSSPEPASEHVFQVSTDRRTWRPVSVLLVEAEVAAFERAHDRPLAPNERYALVKLALFRAFDEHSGPGAPPGPVAIGASDIERIADSLDWL